MSTLIEQIEEEMEGMENTEKAEFLTDMRELIQVEMEGLDSEIKTEREQAMRGSSEYQKFIEEAEIIGSVLNVEFAEEIFFTHSYEPWVNLYIEDPSAGNHYELEFRTCSGFFEENEIGTEVEYKTVLQCTLTGHSRFNTDEGSILEGFKEFLEYINPLLDVDLDRLDDEEMKAYLAETV